MAHKPPAIKEAKPFYFPFEDDGYLLTSDGLDKHLGSPKRYTGHWRLATIKFLYFRQGELCLLSSHEEQSFELRLKLENQQLRVTCSCGNPEQHICEHALAALRALTWRYESRYFEKLKPHGSMTLAFAHQKYFDKEESTNGLNVTPRPELKTVYGITINSIGNLKQVFALPGLAGKVADTNTGEALCWLVTLPARRNMMPALLPCMGRLNKNNTAIRSWMNFLSGPLRQKQGNLSEEEEYLYTAGLDLWKLTEAGGGGIIQHRQLNSYDENDEEQLTEPALIFESWKKILPVLQQQPFVYSYCLYTVRDLKHHPRRQRVDRLTISTLRPNISFLLADKGAFYRFSMQVTVNGVVLADHSTEVPFFIWHQGVLYMLATLRDAGMVEWMEHCKGIVTVFKEHFEAFEQEVLQPIRENYGVSVVK